MPGEISKKHMHRFVVCDGGDVLAARENVMGVLRGAGHDGSPLFERGMYKHGAVNAFCYMTDKPLDGLTIHELSGIPGVRYQQLW